MAAQRPAGRRGPAVVQADDAGTARPGRRDRAARDAGPPRARRAARKGLDLRARLVAAYRGVTRLMPAEYRKRHREASVAVLLRLLRDAEADGGAWRVSVVGLSAVLDALFRVPVEHMKCLRGHAGLSTEGIGRDLRQAVRALFARPLASGAAIATLAVGIGLNAAVFSIIDWILLRPLPYPAPRELVRVLSSPAGATPGR